MAEARGRAAGGGSQRRATHRPLALGQVPDSLPLLTQYTLNAAARTRLKKMQAEAAAKAGAAEAKTPAERSPHAKEVRGAAPWDGRLGGGRGVGDVTDSSGGRSGAPGLEGNLPGRRVVAAHLHRTISGPGRPAPPASRPATAHVPRDCPPSPQSYDAAEFEDLVQKYEKLNWRIIRWGQLGLAKGGSSGGACARCDLLPGAAAARRGPRPQPCSRAR